MLEKTGIREVEKIGIRNEVAIFDSRGTNSNLFNLTNSGFFEHPTACVQANFQAEEFYLQSCKFENWLELLSFHMKQNNFLGSKHVQ